MSDRETMAYERIAEAYERIAELKAENAALRELIIKKGYIVTYFNDTIGLACDPYYKPEQNLP